MRTCVCARAPGVAGSLASRGGEAPGRRRRPRMEVGVEGSDPGGGETWCGCGAGAMAGEKARWKSAHLGCVGRPRGGGGRRKLEFVHRSGVGSTEK